MASPYEDDMGIDITLYDCGAPPDAAAISGENARVAHAMIIREMK